MIEDTFKVGFGDASGEGSMYSDGANILLDMVTNKDFLIRNGTEWRFLFDTSLEQINLRGENGTSSLRLGDVGGGDFTLFNDSNTFKIFHDNNSDDWHIYEAVQDEHRWYIDNVQKLTLDSAGNLGLGIASPTVTYTNGLHLHSANAGVSLHLTDSTTGTTATDGSEIFHHTNDTYIYNRENGDIRFWVNGAERMTLDNNELTMTAAHITMPDNERIYYGTAGVDGSMYSDGVNIKLDMATNKDFFIRNGTTNNFQFDTGAKRMRVYTTDSDQYAYLSGSVLHLNNDTTSQNMDLFKNKLQFTENFTNVGYVDWDGTSLELSVNGTVRGSFTSGGLDVTGIVKTTVYTVAGLPSGTEGDRAFVTDANSTTFNATAASGGSNNMPVFYNGSVWKIG